MPMPSYILSADRADIDVAARTPFALVLDENPTTGYRWALDVDPGLRMISSDYTPRSGAGIGGGGKRQFVLVADAPGQFHAHAKLWRHWLGDASALKHCEIAVRAT